MDNEPTNTPGEGEETTTPPGDGANTSTPEPGAETPGEQTPPGGGEGE